MAISNNTVIEKKLWQAADELRANSKLKTSEYSVPVLVLIFLRYTDAKFAKAEAARWSGLMRLPEGSNIGKAINDNMRAIEDENDDLKDVLPKTYNRMSNSVLVTLLRTFNSIPMDIEGDAFGKIYEYFLGNFAMSEGQRGGYFVKNDKNITEGARGISILRKRLGEYDCCW